jgi:hypothetical protein
MKTEDRRPKTGDRGPPVQLISDPTPLLRLASLRESSTLRGLRSELLIGYKWWLQGFAPSPVKKSAVLPTTVYVFLVIDLGAIFVLVRLNLL